MKRLFLILTISLFSMYLFAQDPFIGKTFRVECMPPDLVTATLIKVYPDWMRFLNDKGVTKSYPYRVSENLVWISNMAYRFKTLKTGVELVPCFDFAEYKSLKLIEVKK